MTRGTSQGEPHSLKGDQIEGKSSLRCGYHCLPEDVSQSAAEETPHPEG